MCRSEVTGTRVYHSVCVGQRSEDNSQESILSLHYVYLRDEIYVPGFNAKCLHPLSHYDGSLSIYLLTYLFRDKISLGSSRFWSFCLRLLRSGSCVPQCSAHMHRYIILCVRVFLLCAWCHGGQKTVLDLLELRLQKVIHLLCGCRESNPGPLKRHPVLLTPSHLSSAYIWSVYFRSVLTM